MKYFDFLLKVFKVFFFFRSLNLIIPKAIAKLIFLTELAIYEYTFTNIPKSIANFTTLTVFVFMENQCVSSIFKFIAN